MAESPSLPDGRIDWQYEYDNQTAFWVNQCRRRWSRAAQLIEAGYKIVLLVPLTKATIAPRYNIGLSNPIDNVDDLTGHTHDGGKHRDCNYGIVAGVGTCVVLDLEGTSEIKGEEYLSTLEATGDFMVPRNAVVTTPRDGFHIYLGWDPDVKARIKPFGKQVGIDVMSSEGDRPTRHVVGPLSVTPDGEYVELKPIPAVSLLVEYQMPPGLKKLLPTSSNVIEMRPEFARGDRGNESVESEDVFEKVSASVIQDMLGHIDCAAVDYDVWVKIGMAVKSELGDEGFQMWQEWSMTDQERYDIKACHSHWESFRGNVQSPVTVGTLIYWASQCGYRPDPTQKVASFLEKIQTETPNVFVGGQCKFIRVTDTGEINEMSTEDARYWYKGQEIFVKNKPMNPIDMFLIWPGRIRYDKFELVPPPAEPSPGVYNTWKGFRVRPEPGDVTRYMELVDAMLVEPTTKEWVHDWFAHMLQLPGEKPPTAIVLRGPGGTGKNMLLNVFRNMFLEDNTIQFVNTEQFMSKFNKRLANSVLAIVNEALWSGNHQHMATLKGMVSEERYEVQDKNVKSFQARNFTRFAVLSNEEWAIPADEAGARRYCVADVPLVRSTDDPWWKETKAILEDPKTLSAIMHWYLERKITSNIIKAPWSEAQAKQTVLTRKRMDKNDEKYVAVLEDILSRNKAFKYNGDIDCAKKRGLRYAVTSKSLLASHQARFGNNPGSAFIKKFSDWLRSLGVDHISGFRIMRNKRLVSVVLLPEPVVLAFALAKHENIGIEHIDRQDQWTVLDDDAPDDVM
jgi:hypothetical protein